MTGDEALVIFRVVTGEGDRGWHVGLYAHAPNTKVDGQDSDHFSLLYEAEEPGVSHAFFRPAIEKAPIVFSGWRVVRVVFHADLLC
jgi:hypothetical protein